MAAGRRRQHRGAPAGGRAAERRPRRRADATARRPTRSSTARPSRCVAKGKAEPIRAWEALAARSRFGVDVDAPADDAARRPQPRARPARLDARARPRGALAAARHARRRARDRQEPARRTSCSGIVERRARARSRWRQGRSLPYGDGVTFWALAEIVKAEAGILESDTHRADRREAAPRGRARSRPTRPRRSGSSGTCGRSSGSAEDGLGRAPEEAFAAWRRFLEPLAAERPLVLVFEDLHWADDALLDFVDELVERASGVPLLVLATARPELLAAPAGLGRRQAERAHDLALAALRRGHGAARAARCSSSRCSKRGRRPRCSRGPAATRCTPSSTRACSNERGDLRRAAGDGAGHHRRPARRALRPRRRAAAGRRGRRQGVLARAPSRRSTASRAGRPRSCSTGSSGRSSCSAPRSSSVGGETRVRVPPRADPRRRLRADPASRAGGEAPAGRGLDRVARPPRGPGRDARAPLPQRARAASAAGLDTAGAGDSARAALRGAGDRAASLYAVEGAEALLRRRAATLAGGRPGAAAAPPPPLGPDPGSRGADRGRGAPVGGRDALLAAGDRATAAEAEMLSGRSYFFRGERRSRACTCTRAEELVGDLPPTRQTVEVLTRVAGSAMIAGDSARCLSLATRALEAAQALDWPEGLASVLVMLGSAQVNLGDPGGLALVQRGVDQAREAGALGLLTQVLNGISVVWIELATSEPRLARAPRLPRSRSGSARRPMSGGTRAS